MDDREVLVGIDLGTTNSEVAALVDGRPQLIGPEPNGMLPSCVGFSPDGQLLVGAKARNQSLVYPELTVRSIKRKMGNNEKVLLGEKAFTPPEISAFLLRELAEWAARSLGRDVRKAVITVPAYFSDAQRQATREAGALAGLEVVRILNEPTAASLAYGLGDESRKTVLVYDLGGGTFDVSVVTIEKDVTEVLASHGNNHLGGDDFDQLLLERLLAAFQKRHGIDLKDMHPASYARLRWAAEEAKKKLSFEPYAVVREEALATRDGAPLHLEVEVSREEYEEMISPLVEGTLESVAQALDDAGKFADEIDAVLLVGGSTRTPLVARVLTERVGIVPRQEVHPDLCVALGAGLLAGRLAGHDVERVLVDVSPYSFGPSYLGERDGRMYPHCYHPIIHRNTPLPVTRTDRYFTAHPGQTVVDVEIFQGDDPDALKNILVGRFRIEGLTPTSGQNEVLCRMSLDLDGVLKVTAEEKRTGMSKHITIRDALKAMSPEEIAAARERLDTLYSARAEELDEMFIEGEVLDAGDGSAEAEDASTAAEGAYVAEDDARPGPKTPKAIREAKALVERSRGLLETVHDDDREEMIGLHEQIEEAIGRQDEKALAAAAEELRELLFFIEGS